MPNSLLVKNKFGQFSIGFKSAEEMSEWKRDILQIVNEMKGEDDIEKTAKKEAEKSENPTEVRVLFTVKKAKVTIFEDDDGEKEFLMIEAIRNKLDLQIKVIGIELDIGFRHIEGLDVGL